MASEQERLDRETKRAARRAARRAVREVLASAARRVLRADYRAAVRIYRARGGVAVQNELGGDSAERFKRGLASIVADVAFSVTEPKSAVLGEVDEENPVMARWLEDYTSELSRRLSATTYGQVMDIVRTAANEGWDVEKTALAIEEKAKIQVPHRARLIARNEMQRVTKGASWVQAVTSGRVVGKVRRELTDDRVRDEHAAMRGQFRPLDQPYSNGEMWAGETEINCRGWDDYVLAASTPESDG